MPKRIPNLSESILAEAARLFSEYGYDAVEMKQVAAEAGTSVGNLYNYYPSKPALFLAIHTNWRKQLFKAYGDLMARKLPRRDKILGVLKRLYDDVAGWQGLWKEFMSGDDARSHLLKAKNEQGNGRFGLSDDDLSLMASFEVLLTGQASPDGHSRWALLVIMATLQMAKRFPQNHEENWKFIETLVDKI